MAAPELLGQAVEAMRSDLGWAPSEAQFVGSPFGLTQDEQTQASTCGGKFTLGHSEITPGAKQLRPRR